MVNTAHEGVVEVIGVDNEVTSRDDGLACSRKSRSLASSQKPMMFKVVEVHENGVEVVREVVVELEVRVLYVDEDAIVLEIVEVREDVIEIVKVLMMQLHQETFIMMHKSELAASGRIGSMKAV